jgi:hypothetical protein
MRRAPLGGCLLALVAAAAPTLPTAAQEMITTGPQPYDRARFSGFWWRGEINGTVEAPQLDVVPGLAAPMLDVTEDLGFDGGSNGWLLGADVGVAPRHRFLFAFAGLSQSATVDLPRGNGAGLAAASEISLRDVRGAYQFLFVSRPWLRAGVIGGIGYVDSGIDVAVRARPDANGSGAPEVGISEVFESPYPLVGGSIMFEAEDVLGVYAEITGSPDVDAGSGSGWLMNFDIDFIVSPTPEISIVTGYKRYRLDLDDGSGVGVDLVWDGFLVGGRYVF